MKSFKNQSYQKMSITKNVLLNWYFQCKKNEKDSCDFWQRKLSLKVKFWHFNNSHSPWACWLSGKNISIFVSIPRLKTPKTVLPYLVLIYRDQLHPRPLAWNQIPFSHFFCVPEKFERFNYWNCILNLQVNRLTFKAWNS